MNGAILNYIQTRQGLEPIVIIGITWGGATYLFSSKHQFIGRANVISIGACNWEKKVDSRSTSGSVSVSFDDTDGFLKFVVDQIIAEKSPAKVFLTFAEDRQS